MEESKVLWDIINNGKSGKNIGLSTGLSKLDKIIGGIQPSRYYVIGAGSSVGKSALVIYMMYNLLKTSNDPITFIYYSLELGSEIILSKILGLYCAEEFGVYLTTNDIMSFETPISEENYQYLLKAQSWFDNLKHEIIIIDKGLSARILYKETMPILSEKGYTETINGKEVYYLNEPNRKIIGIIDHLSLVRPEENRNKKAEMDLVSSYIVTIKRKFKMSWFVLMQQNRDSSSMDRRKADLSEPGLNDLKDTSSAAEDADVVLQLFFPYREKLTTYRGYKILGEDGIKRAMRSCIISKNRYGIANQVIPLGFYGSVGWFKELPKPEEINKFSDYIDESNNIPCKIKKIVENKDEVFNLNFTL